MHELELANGESLHAYKNLVTRRYVHLGLDGSVWRLLDERYVCSSASSPLRYPSLGDCRNSP